MLTTAVPGGYGGGEGGGGKSGGDDGGGEGEGGGGEGDGGGGDGGGGGLRQDGAPLVGQELHTGSIIVPVG